MNVDKVLHSHYITAEYKAVETTELKTLTIEEANELVIQHTGWAESIARSVARGWNLDWQQDGLDGAAMEALIFCSRRFSLERGVPFKGYARRRIHEASTEAARKSKGWEKKGTNSKNERLARAISAELFDIFPGLRSGNIPTSHDSDSGEQPVRVSIRQLLVGATLIATKQDLASSDPDAALDFKKALGTMAKLEVVHQLILWKIYWCSESMRGIASSWEIDELNVIREHKVILEYIQKTLARGKPPSEGLRVRPGLKQTALKLKREGIVGPLLKMYEETKRT